MQQEQEQPASTPRKHGPLTLWKPGQSGNPKGRAKGSRNKLSEAFCADVYAMWAENGPGILRVAAMQDPPAMCRLVAGLVPKDFNVQHTAGPSFRALWEAVATGKIPKATADEDDGA